VELELPYGIFDDVGVGDLVDIEVKGVDGNYLWPRREF
jgi:hypothetical protein